MKKLLSILALALCFVACQNEAVESVNNGDLANVVLTIDAPELGVTRADGDTLVDGTPKNGKNSAYGAIDFLSDADWANYDLRYILEVYGKDDDGTGEPIYRERLVNCLDKYAPTTFELRLVPERTYKFVVFADFVAEGSAEATDKLAIADLYYNTADLNNISAITTEQTWGAMNEIRDAYFISQNVKVTNGLNETLTLTRPFAKLRVIATDLDYIAGYSKPGYVEVAYHTEKIYKSFNAVNGELNTTEMAGDELKYGYEVSKTIPYTAGYDEFSTNQTLFTDYLLAVEGEQTTVNFTIAVYEDATKTRKIHEHDFNTQIPIQRNHLTTIIGDLLTTQANITIEIDDNFVDEFVVGWGDDNSTKINVWNAGVLNANGDYTFVVNGENNFKVTVNGAAVKNQKLTAGDYVLAEDAEEGAELTFTVEELQANETTRALTAVEVIGGTMKVESIDDNYKITLDLVLEFSENKDVRHAIYTYEGPISFGKVLETPKVEAAVEGNVITLTWNAVADATSYTITGVAENPVVTEETTYVFTGEYETEYTFTVAASNGTLYSQPYTIVATTKAAPVVEEAYKLYFNNLANWTKVYAHIWANDGEDLGLESVEWPGRELTETEELNGVTYYVFQLPAEATGKTVNVVFNDGNGTKTKDLSGVVEGNLFFDNYVEPVVPSDVVLYLQPNANWNVDGARFAAYFFGNGETWVDMTLVEGETNIYAVTVPAGFENIIFCRMNPGAAANNWDNKWNQTSDLTVPTDGTNLYTVKEDTWNEGGGEWSVYAPAVVEPTYTTVAEFLAAAEDDTVYTLKGTITRVDNTYYGNFDLTDETGTVYIYGLCSPEGAQKYWEESKAKLGDDIVVKTVRSSHNGNPQGKDAIFVELISPGTLAFWSFDATAASFTAAGGDKEIGLAIYNTTAEVVATSDNSQFTAAYADGALTITALENTTADKIEGNIIVTCGSLNQTIAVSQAEYKEPGETPDDTTGVYTSMDFLFKDKTVTNTSTGQTQGTNAYKQSMNLDDGSTIDVLKLGTSSKAGSFETAAVGVSGKSKLSFYAVAWKGKTAKLTVTVDGKATELTLKANTGATGNPPYNDSEGALEFNDDTDYYTVDVTGITADSTVTFATDNTGYRALICGVQLY